MHPDEEDPHRTVRNKNAIDKVMFFSAVGRPRFDDEGRCYFDGKLGTWPFVRTVQTCQHMICNPVILLVIIIFIISGTSKKKKRQ
jgi:hypothetical protein